MRRPLKTRRHKTQNKRGVRRQHSTVSPELAPISLREPENEEACGRFPVHARHKKSVNSESDPPCGEKHRAGGDPTLPILKRPSTAAKVRRGFGKLGAISHCGGLLVFRWASALVLRVRWDGRCFLCARRWVCVHPSSVHSCLCRNFRPLASATYNRIYVSAVGYSLQI